MRRSLLDSSNTVRSPGRAARALSEPRDWLKLRLTSKTPTATSWRCGTTASEEYWPSPKDSANFLQPLESATLERRCKHTSVSTCQHTQYRRCGERTLFCLSTRSQEFMFRGHSRSNFRVDLNVRHAPLRTVNLVNMNEFLGQSRNGSPVGQVGAARLDASLTRKSTPASGADIFRSRKFLSCFPGFPHY